MSAAADDVKSLPGLSGNVVDYLFEHRLKPGESERPYLLMPTGNVSFGAVYKRACQTAHMLRRLGLGIGERVMFSVKDGQDFPAIFAAGMKIGAVSVPLNTFLKLKDYAYYIRDSEAKVVIVDIALADMVREAVKGIPTVKHLLVTGGKADGFVSFDEAIANEPDAIETVPRKPDDMAFWLYSSGSTGDPKGVVHTHEHIYWATELFGIRAQGVQRDDVIQCPPKMFFAFGLGNQVYFPIRTGASVIVETEAMKPDRGVASLVKHRPTILVSVPTLFAGMLTLMREMPPGEVAQACSRLRFCVSGGEVLPAAVFRAWKELTGTEILDGVGTTEMTHMFILNRLGKVVAGSCGTAVAGFDCRLVDDNWQPVPQGEVGNLFAIGPSAAREYWNKPEKTASTMRDGGVLTGDKFYQDKDGNFFYVGRNDDMLRVGAIWVSPAEIESALAEHAAVQECAVIGVPDENAMIKPKAFVILKPGNQSGPALEDALKGFLREKLAHFKCPRWIDFVSELPKTATGKIQRFRLREQEGGR
jgi:benzoate-CoA ligase family protein